MASRVLDPVLTPDDLLVHPEGESFELMGGKLVEKPMSVLSSMVEFLLLMALGEYCRSTKRGQCWPSSLAYRIFSWEPDRIVRPDATFVASGRLSNEVMHQGYMTIVPDLATEVLSIHDLAYAVDEKTESYLRAGVKLVWIINPDKRRVMIHRLDGSTAKLHETDELDGEGVLPGFLLPVRELFPKD